MPGGESDQSRQVRSTPQHTLFMLAAQ